jgi:hypothetical protein
MKWLKAISSMTNKQNLHKKQKFHHPMKREGGEEKGLADR